MRDYRAIFEHVESTLISVASRNLSPDEIRAHLNKTKEIEVRAFSDDEHYLNLVCVIFYSGFRAARVRAKLPSIRRYFSDYNAVAEYGEDEIDRILHDPEMIKNEQKVRACVRNAQVFKDIVAEHGSFQAYVGSLAPTESFENLMLLKEELEWRFKGIGRVTAYHCLTDMGLPVLKPDRVIRRIFQRLGLIESDKQLLKTVIQGRKFAQATGHPIRYIDEVLVLYGQMESSDLGKGICLERNPQCSICGVRPYCSYRAEN